MKRPLSFRLYLLFLFICLLAVSLPVFFLGPLKQKGLDALTGYAESFSEPLVRAIEPPLRHGDLDAVNRLLKEYAGTSDLRASLLSMKGERLADSGRSAAADPIPPGPELDAAAAGITRSDIRYSVEHGERMLFVAVPIMEDGRVLGVLHIRVPGRRLLSLLGGIQVKVSLVAGAVFLLSLAGALIFGWWFARPVKQLNDLAGRAAEGDYSAKLFLDKNNVLGELAEHYNRMIERVRSSVDDLRSQKEELNCIIESMQPGLLVLDPEGRVCLYNESAQRILHVHEIKSRLYWEVLRELPLWDTIQSVQRTGRNSKEEVEIDGSFYQVTTAHLPSINETVMVFHDITDIKSLERIKADFVTNVSHELRTPLTAIKGYAETIEGVNQENIRYLDIIKRHTNRLISIVEDLLTLSQLEQVNTLAQKEPVDLETTIDHVLRMFESRIREKGLAVSKRVQPGLPVVHGDPLKLEQLFINLVDNAITYTEEGTISIELRGHRSSVSVKVSDTGIGIPERHLPRIFERFYTVDKSRSRRLGGTGLGLSIVKHIVQLHGGSVEVRSAPGRGTDVTVRLPV